MTPTQAEIEKAKDVCALPLRDDRIRIVAKALADARENVEREAEVLVEILSQCIGLTPKSEIERKAVIAAWREKHGGHPK